MKQKTLDQVCVSLSRNIIEGAQIFDPAIRPLSRKYYCMGTYLPTLGTQSSRLLLDYLLARLCITNPVANRVYSVN